MSNNEIKIFENEEFGSIRTVTIDGEAWFVGKDVAEALGYKNNRDALSKHIDIDEKADVAIHDGRQNRTMTVINESGIYALVFGSKLESAKKFSRWVRKEVLPQIRKTGGYIPIEENDSNEVIMAKALLIADKTIKQKDAIITQKENIIQEQKPLVDFAHQVSNTDDLIDMNQMAKLLKKDDIKIGRNRLFQFLRSEKVLMKNNLPYQRFIEQGYFKTKEVIKQEKVYVTTYVTGKGQLYINNLVKEKYRCID